ncbi:MAG: helix-turn-helix domain-containing protein [Christensenellales bacterium]
MIICNLRSILADKHMTQTELARRSSVRPVAISHMCNGHNPHFSADTANKLCSVLQCNVGDIWRYVPDKQ